MSLSGLVRAAAVAASVGVGSWSAFSPRTQLFGSFPYCAETDERVVALTFDDGPNEPYTSQLLEVLDRRQVRATFFQVGRCAERFPSATRAVVAAGHVLGNHSYSHEFHRYASQPTQRAEIARAQETLTCIAGTAPALYRPPWLCHWPWVLRSAGEAGLQVVSGEFGSAFEVFQPAGERMARSATAITRPGSILIFHDGREGRGGRRDQTVAAIDPLIDSLQDKGYRFAGVDELLGVDAQLS